MASVLSSVCQSLTAGTSISEAGFTQTSGSNRIVFVGLSFESASAPETVSSPQWAGQTMTPVTDGTTQARGTTGTGFSAWVQWFQILEADLPTDTGTKTFSCTLSGAPGEGAICVVIVGDAAQGANVEEVDTYGVAGAGNPTWSVTAATDDSVAIGMAACGNSGTFSPSTGFTEIASEQNLASSGHQAMQGAFSSGAISATHSFSGTVNRAAAAGFVVSNGAVPIDVNGSLQAAEATVAGSLNKVRDVTGALQAAEATTAGSLNKLRDVDGALQSAASTVAGSLNKVRDVTGALVQAGQVAAGSLNKLRDVTGSLQSAAAQLHDENSNLVVNQHITNPMGSTGFLADSGSRSHEVVAGSNRVLLAVVILNDGTPTGLSLSIGGQAFSLRDTRSTVSSGGITVATFQLLEADIPSAGAQTLQVGFTSSESTAWVHVSQFDAVRQIDLPVDSAAGATFASGSFNVSGPFARDTEQLGRRFMAAAVDAPFVPRYSGELLPGTGTTKTAGIKASDDSTANAFRVFLSEQNDSDSNHFPRITNDGTSFGGAVVFVGTTVGLPPAADTSIDGALQSTAATVAGSLDVESQINGALEAAPVTAAGSLNKLRDVSGALQSAAVVAAGSLNKLRDVSGALTQAAASAAGTLNKLRDVDGALQAAAQTVAGELELATNVVGALQAAAVTVAGSLNKLRDVTGALESAAAVVAGTATVGGGVQGFLDQAAATVAGSLDVESQINGALEAAPVSAAGTLNKIRAVNGALESAAAILAGTLDLTPPTEVDGALQQAASSLAGTLNKLRDINGALDSAAAVVSGSLTVQAPILVTGALTQAAAAAAGTLNRLRDITGDLAAAAADVAGTIQQTQQLNGALTQAASVISGNLSSVPPTEVTGALQQAAAVVAGTLAVQTEVVGALEAAATVVSGAVVVVVTPKIPTCLEGGTLPSVTLYGGTRASCLLQGGTVEAALLFGGTRSCK